MISFRVITIAAQDRSPSWAGNEHRICVKEETDNAWIGWADPTDSRNSPHHKPGIDRPTTYPKFAWRQVD